jgi:hypothetical protein
MIRILPIVTLVGFLIGGVTITVKAQNVPSVGIYNGRTFVAAKITIASDITPLNTEIFSWTPLLPLKRGNILAARGVIEGGQENQIWSVKEHSFTVGTTSVNYPVFGIMTFQSTGNTTVIPSIITIKQKINAGENLHANGNLISTDRPLEMGMVIPTLVIINGDEYIMSIKASTQQKSGAGEAVPFLIIGHEAGVSDNRAETLEAWRKTNESMKVGFPTMISSTGQPLSESISRPARSPKARNKSQGGATSLRVQLETFGEGVTVELRQGVPGNSKVVESQKANGGTVYFSNLCHGSYFMAVGNEDEVQVTPVRQFEDNRVYESKIVVQKGPSNVASKRRSML